VAVGAHILAHQDGVGVGAVLVADIGSVVAHLDLRGVLPHLELVYLARIEEEAGEGLQGQQADEGHTDDQQNVLKHGDRCSTVVVRGGRFHVAACLLPIGGGRIIPL